MVQLTGKSLISYQLHGDLFHTYNFADLSPRAVWLCWLLTAGDSKDPKPARQKNQAPGDSKKQLNLHPANSGHSDRLKFSLLT